MKNLPTTTRRLHLYAPHFTYKTPWVTEIINSEITGSVLPDWKWLWWKSKQDSAVRPGTDPHWGMLLRTQSIPVIDTPKRKRHTKLKKKVANLKPCLFSVWKEVRDTYSETYSHPSWFAYPTSPLSSPTQARNLAADQVCCHCFTVLTHSVPNS